MKRVMLSICAAALVVSSLGCVCNCNNCRTKRCHNGGGLGSGHGLCGHHQVSPPGTAGYAYPYYTLRGPRDFLSANPRGIGP